MPLTGLELAFKNWILPYEGNTTYVYIDSSGHGTIGIGFNLDAAGAAQIYAGAGLANPSWQQLKFAESQINSNYPTSIRNLPAVQQLSYIQNTNYGNTYDAVFYNQISSSQADAILDFMLTNTNTSGGAPVGRVFQMEQFFGATVWNNIPQSKQVALLDISWEGWAGFVNVSPDFSTDVINAVVSGNWTTVANDVAHSTWARNLTNENTLEANRVNADVNALRTPTVPQPNCFIQGTLVSTPNGLTPIEQIKKGDSVCTYDLELKKMVINTVAEIIEGEEAQSVVLDFGTEKIECTPSHPFYTGEWVIAGDLKTGDSVMDINGHWIEIKSIHHIAKLQKVYNLHVNEIHNYFVGKTALLVHNNKRVNTNPTGSSGTGGGGTGGGSGSGNSGLGGGLSGSSSDANSGTTGVGRGGPGNTGTDPLGGNGDPGSCFVKGTLISTENGLRPIELVRKGDEIYCYNFESKKVELKPIEEVFESEQNQFVILDFGSEKIECTRPHRFYTGEWLAAENLKVEDSVMDIKGKWNTIKGIQYKTEPQQVINFRISTHHNYFVGKAALLVHNDKMKWDNDPLYIFNPRF